MKHSNLIIKYIMDEFKTLTKENKHQRKKIKQKKDDVDRKMVSDYVSKYNTYSKIDKITTIDVENILSVKGISFERIMRILNNVVYSDKNAIGFKELFKNPYHFSITFPILMTYKQCNNIVRDLRIENVPPKEKVISFIYNTIIDECGWNNNVYIQHKWFLKQVEQKNEEGLDKRLIQNVINEHIVIDNIYIDKRSFFPPYQKGYKALCVTILNFRDIEDECQQILNELCDTVVEDDDDFYLPKNVVRLSNRETLTELQQQAVINSIDNAISIITGGPGSGKTTTIKAINRYSKETNTLTINLAYCGKAVRNISHKFTVDTYDYKTTSRCYTLHKFLNHEIYNKENHDNYFESVIIVDEISMIDLCMLHSLLRFVRKYDCTLVLVGDDDQLGPIGIGNPFEIIMNNIKKHSIKCVRFTSQPRFNDTPVILDMLNEIKTKQFDVANNTYGDKYFNFENIENIRDISDFMEEYLVKQKLHDIKDLRKPAGVLFLTAENKHIFGKDNLNNILQKIINSKHIEYQYEIVEHFNSKSFTFYNGDKVLRRVNNYSRKISRFNGDEAIVFKIINDGKRQIRVKYWNARLNDYGNGEKEKYVGDEDYEENITIRELKEEFDLGYVRTIHKSQGGEARHIILFGPNKQHQTSWKNIYGKGKKLLRVAVSRGTHKIHVICLPEQIKEIIEKKNVMSTTKIFNI